MNHSPEGVEPIENGKLFPNSALLNPEKATSDMDKAEESNAKEEKR